MNRQFELLDVITIVSFIIAIQNLSENEQQTQSLKDHLNKQDDEYLKKSIKQNELIIKQNETIIKLLKERS